MPFLKDKRVRKLVVIMSILTLFAVLFTWQYYSGVNRSVDPRVKEARNLYEKYNSFASAGSFDSVFALMDTIESIYGSVEHYRMGYETGVLYNNRAAAGISLFSGTDLSLATAAESMLIEEAEKNVKISISCYEDWQKMFSTTVEEAIENQIRESFLDGLESYSPKEQEKFLQQRIREISEALNENPRRLSVAYTNLGLIKRYQQKYDTAVLFYQKALELWNRNLSAENNMNILLNRPVKKRTTLEKIFPPKK